ncbi:MAG: response regulator [Desulfobacterales bacterium]
MIPGSAATIQGTVAEPAAILLQCAVRFSPEARSRATGAPYHMHSNQLDGFMQRNNGQSPQAESSVLKRVLVVDDEEAVRRLVAAYLSRYGFSVESAADGKQALQRLEKASFDLVITDLHMAEVDGSMVSRALKERFPRTVVVIMTGDLTVDLKHLSHVSQADMVLYKPFSMDQLPTLGERFTNREVGPGCASAVFKNRGRVRSTLESI